MISYKVGDLIKAAQDGEVSIIAHGCNCFCTMGSGIAPLIKGAFPEAYAADLQTEKGDESKLGTASFGISREGKLWVFNLYQQHNYDRRRFGLRDLKYDALYDSLVYMRDVIKDTVAFNSLELDARIGLPKLGAGLAGGDWNVIEAMIDSVFRDFDVTVYVLNEKEIPK